MLRAKIADADFRVVELARIERLTVLSYPQVPGHRKQNQGTINRVLRPVVLAGRKLLEMLPKLEIVIHDLAGAPPTGGK